MDGAQCTVAMSQTTYTTDLTISELEANFSLYCKALRILVLEEKPIHQIRRSVCWHRLQCLHHCLPGKYRNPEHLYFLLKREWST